LRVAGVSDPGYSCNQLPRFTGQRLLLLLKAQYA